MPCPPPFSALLGLLLLPGNAQDLQPIDVAVPNRKEAVRYSAELLDILDAKCTGCHNSVLAENGLNMETVAGMVKGGKRGPSLVPGKADESLLFRMAAHRVEPVMPPREKANLKPLTPDELGLLKLWIDQGAKDDSDEAEPSAGTIVLGDLPPGLHEIVSADLTPDGRRIAAGRANVVQVFDADSGIEITRLGGHQDIIQSVRFNADGSRLAAGSYQIVTVWNVPTGGPDRSFSPHGDQVQALAAPPDGSFFVTASLDRNLRIWDPNADQPIQTITLPDSAQPVSLALSRDGKRLASGGSDGKVRIWNRELGQWIKTLDLGGGPVRSVGFSPDGSLLVAGSDGAQLKVFPISDDPALPSSDPIPLEGHSAPVTGALFLANGTQVATASLDRTLRIWDLASHSQSRTIGAGNKPIHSLALSPDGSKLAAGFDDGTASIYTTASGEEGPTLRGHTGPLHGIAFSPSGDRIASAGQDGAVKVWETTDGQGVIAFGHTPASPGPLQPLHAVAFLGPERLVTASADKSARTWKFSGRWQLAQTLGPHVFRVLSLDFSPDGTKLAASGGEPSRSGELKVWDLATGTLDIDLPELHSDTIFAVRYSPDGSRIATGGADKFARVLNVADKKPLRAFEGHTHHVMGVDWNADGKQLASAGADNVVKLWDVETGEQIRTTQAAGNQVTGLRWVAGKPILLGSSGDKTVRAWNPETGQVARTFTGPNDYLYTVSTSQDGTRVLSGGAEGTLFLWNGENGQLIRKIEFPATEHP